MQWLYFVTPALANKLSMRPPLCHSLCTLFNYTQNIHLQNRTLRLSVRVCLLVSCDNIWHIRFQIFMSQQAVTESFWSVSVPICVSMLGIEVDTGEITDLETGRGGARAGEIIASCVAVSHRGHYPLVSPLSSRVIKIASNVSSAHPSTAKQLHVQMLEPKLEWEIVLHYFYFVPDSQLRVTGGTGGRWGCSPGNWVSLNTKYLG